MSTWIRIRRYRGSQHWWSWPWMHWCLFDPECQAEGNPRRIYVHVLCFYVDFGPNVPPTMNK